MNKLIKYYLYFIPFFSLVGILISCFRVTYHDHYTETFLIISAGIDFLIILSGFKYLFNNNIGIILLLLIFSFIVGALNNELSRRFISDFSNPFFFFAKIYIFAKYWQTNDFKVYVKYYTWVAFAGSIILLPVVYFLFRSTGNTRLAIFPPMELPFSNYMLSNSLLLLITFIVILLYGKRAQLFSAIIVFLFYTLFFKRDQIIKYIFIFLICTVATIYIFDNYSDNLAVGRLKNTFDLYKGEESGNNNLDQISAGRYNEFETIISQMKLKDYFLGKGMGFVYNIDTGSDYVETANAHFSPIGFISKYGLLFTLFVYYFISSVFLKTNKKLLSNSDYVIALGVSVFIFIQSFFAYAFFVTPIFPIVLGVLICLQRKRKVNLSARRRIRNLNQQPKQIVFDK